MMKHLLKILSRSFIGACVLIFLTAPVVADPRNIQEQYQSLKAEFSQLRQSRQQLQQRELSGTQDELTIRVIVGNGRYIEAAQGSRVSPSADWQKLQQLTKQYHIKTHHRLDRQQLMAVDITESQLDKLMQVQGFDYIVRDEIAWANLTESVHFVGADQVHSAGFAGQEHAVAILDTGVDNSHPFFTGRIVEEACFSSGDGVTGFSLCPNGESQQFGPGAADDCMGRYDSFDCMHGTHVAGIAAGSNSTMSGMAPSANIVAIQIFTYFGSNNRLGAYTSDQVAALDWLLNEAQTPNITSANMSLGGGLYSVACDDWYPQAPVIATLREQGTATVIASGNDGADGAVSAPGCISSAVTVGSTEKYADIISYFSNSSDLVDLLAPGSNIYSSVPGDSYSWMSGTSMATPHVTGAFATLRSFVPDASVDEIENALKTTGVPITDVEANVTMPRIDLLAAYTLLGGDDGDDGSCTVLPGVVTENGGEIANGQSKSWAVLAANGGLFRVHVSSVSQASSNLIRVNFADQSVVIGVSSGSSSLVDFPNVPAGLHTLSIDAMSEGVNIGTISVEQLANDGSVTDDECRTDDSIPIPGVISENVGAIAVGESRSWNLLLDQVSNVRIALISGATLASREIELNFNELTLRLSLDPGQSVYVDFAGVSMGEKPLTITATNDGVILGKLEATTY